MKIYYKIYKDGKYIDTSFTYCLEGSKQVLENKGYTIEIL